MRSDQTTTSGAIPSAVTTKSNEHSFLGQAKTRKRYRETRTDTGPVAVDGGGEKANQEPQHEWPGAEGKRPTWSC